MQTPLEIAFVDMPPSAAVEARIRERVQRLERRYDGITSCHVYVAEPHQHSRKGNLFQVRVELRVPGAELAVTGQPGDVNAHEDVYVALRDSFDVMERRLEEWKERVRGQVKLHEAPLQGRVVEIHPGQDYGKIATTDGGLVYFHRNAVVDGDFEDLKPQDAVELVAQYGESEQGPQASTVRPVSSLSR
jgi:ribosomal subunit interface protein